MVDWSYKYIETSEIVLLLLHANFCSFVIDVEVGETIEDTRKQFSLKSGTTITFQ